jgi:hypothetical protein
VFDVQDETMARWWRKDDDSHATPIGRARLTDDVNDEWRDNERSVDSRAKEPARDGEISNGRVRAICASEKQSEKRSGKQSERGDGANEIVTQTARMVHGG